VGKRSVATTHTYTHTRKKTIEAQISVGGHDKPRFFILNETHSRFGSLGTEKKRALRAVSSDAMFTHAVTSCLGNTPLGLGLKGRGDLVRVRAAFADAIVQCRFCVLTWAFKGVIWLTFGLTRGDSVNELV